MMEESANIQDNFKVSGFETTTDTERASNKPVKEKATHRRQTACIELTDRYVYRRAFSESRLLDAVGVELKEGHSYHFITGGDVDALSYCKMILLHQNLEHLLFSTWCMAAEDILQFDLWLQEGKIKKLDAYVGEIFPNNYKVEWEMLRDLFSRHSCGRIAVFRNHSKIFAGYGNKFAFGIETSANINTNPRTENGCITIAQGIYEFYKDYFDGIISFEKEDRESPGKGAKNKGQ